MEIESGKRHTLIDILQKAAEQETRFGDGTFRLDLKTKETHHLVCQKELSVAVITALLRQTNPQKKHQNDGPLMAVVAGVGLTSPTVLFEQPSSETGVTNLARQILARQTLDKACLDTQCETNGCFLKNLSRQTKEQSSKVKREAYAKTQETNES